MGITMFASLGMKVTLRKITTGFFAVLVVLAGRTDIALADDWTGHEVESEGLVAAQAERADAFRAELGFPPAKVAFANAEASPSSLTKWGLLLTPSEEADLEERSSLQEQLGGVQRIVDANTAYLGGAWLDQRAGDGHGFVLMIAFADQIDARLLDDLTKELPLGVRMGTVIVDRSFAELEAIQAQVLEATRKTERGYVASVAIKPQDNVVELMTADGRVPAGLNDRDGLVTERGSTVPAFVPNEGGNGYVYCSPDDRCYLRYFRGGVQIIDKTASSGGWEQCTSGFYARKTTASAAIVMVTAAHCQVNFYDDTVYGKDDTEVIGGWGSDTTPPDSIFCMDICDMEVEVQLINNLTSVPSTRNTIYLDSANKAWAITSWRSYGSGASWVGGTICHSGTYSGKQCGTITSVGTFQMPMPKRGYDARMSKIASTTAMVHGGDSGGPVTNSHTAYGTSSGVYDVNQTTKFGKLAFSALSPALDDLDIDLCTSPAC